ncbi:hypothetical protein C8J55DRAFT_497702 [Lentinula edodes]|uniref:Uncharacterized protein n=1 Tax=Lentinula lateritia TaxID=40482 RepID=A0A9W9B034_9AGAR|nr:hypothetical protein C8J55DRAFT_497702 [Lentinula edodes]
MRSKALNRIAKANACDVLVKKADVLWLGAYAFHKILSGRPQRYSSLLKRLKFDMERGKNRHRRNRFRKVLDDGSAFSLEVSRS